MEVAACRHLCTLTEQLLFFACHVRSSNMADEHVFLLAKGGMLQNQLPEEDI